MPATPVLPDLADSFISEQPDPTEATAVHAEDIDAPITAGDPLFHGTPAPALASQTAPAESVTTVEPAAPVEDSADEVRHVYSPAAAPERIASGNGVIIETVPTNEGSLISASGNNPDPAIEGWVAQIKLSGVRLGATPKVLMNDRVFQIGDVVDRRTGLVLSAIENRELQFRDPAGNTYVLRF
ncbi:MAG: hypothetical protein D6781_10395 [Verrucomicrobia bacterium]|nr:MAG: hypothetical protein D6781_10395 [Verrucomicrobiota bacterium]